MNTNSSNPLVTVLITTYNCQSTILSTLISISNQTFKDFEIVIIDDGSTDQTYKLIDDFKKNISHINFIPCAHRGRYYSLSYGIEKSLGKFIAICDSDDLWSPHKLKLQTDLMLTKKLDFSLTDFNIIYSDFHAIPQMQKHDFNNSFKLNLAKILTTPSMLCHSSFMVKKELCNYSQLSSQLDLDIYLRLLDLNHQGMMLANKLVYKRVHEAQSFESKNNLIYRLNALKLQLPYIIKEKLFYVLIVRLLKLLIGLFPQKIRMLFKKCLK